jgi:integrase
VSSQPNRLVSYDVRVWKIERYSGAKGDTYRVRWTVNGERYGDQFKKRPQADSFRSKLLTYASDGVAFDVETGLPVPMLQEQRQAQLATPTWYEHAVEYAARQWPDVSAKQRASIADTLATVSLVLIRSYEGKPDPATVRGVLSSWAFNVNARSQTKLTPEQAAALAWLQENTLRVGELADPEVMERALRALASKLDGTPAAANTYRRKRPIFYAALKYAVKRKHLAVNPLADEDIDFTPPKAVEAVDPRTVPNPRQAKALIAATEQIKPAGPPLTAFFGCLYFCGMRPGEAVSIREEDFVLPNLHPDDEEQEDDEWGTAYLDTSAARSGRSWTDTGTTRQERQLKHRPKGTVRPVPVSPALVRLILKHIDQHGTTSDGRLFRGVRGGILSESTYSRVWGKARVIALTDAQVASSLAKHPYNLRHACVSTWLKAGIEPKRVAEWAGHSVEVLLRIYTHCLDEGEHEALRRIQKTLEDASDLAKTPRSTSGRIWGGQPPAPSDSHRQSPPLTGQEY